jgi:predicted DNA-binding transcriptional regulator YafY
LKVQLTFELIQMILGYGNEIEVIAPQSLREQIQAKLAATLAKYD